MISCLFLDWDLRLEKQYFENYNRRFVDKQFLTAKQPCSNAEKKGSVCFREVFTSRTWYRSPATFNKLSEIRAYLNIFFFPPSICLSKCIDWKKTTTSTSNKLKKKKSTFSLFCLLSFCTSEFLLLFFFFFPPFWQYVCSSLL